MGQGLGSDPKGEGAGNRKYLLSRDNVSWTFRPPSIFYFKPQATWIASRGKLPAACLFAWKAR
jgi:hypothetical protein